MFSLMNLEIEYRLLPYRVIFDTLGLSEFPNSSFVQRWAFTKYTTIHGGERSQKKQNKRNDQLNVMERRTNSGIIRQKKNNKHFLSGKLRKENLAPNLMV